MDENAIFKNPSEMGIQNQVKQPEVVVDNPIAPPSEVLPAKPSSSMPFKILKLLLGAAIVAGIIFIVLNFVLPKFFTGFGESKTTLVYWGLLDDSLQLAPIIADFEKNNPNIKIDYSKQDIKQYSEKLVTRSNNGNGPDIFRFHNSWVPMLGELLLPLPSDTVSKEDFLRNYYPAVKIDLIKDGAIYGVPLQIDILNLYINSELFQAAGLSPPATWIEFVNYSRQLTLKDENNIIKTAGAAMGTASNIDHASDIVSMLMAQNGVNLKNISENISASADALNFYTSFALGPGNVWDETLESSLSSFANNSLAMYFGYARDYSLIKSKNPNLAFEIYPVPTLADRNQTIASYWVEGISSKSTHQKEALIFLKYLIDNKTQQKLFAEEAKITISKPYARIDLAESIKNMPNVYPFASQINDAVSSYFVDGTFDNGINTKMNAALNSAIDSVLRGASPQSAMETFSLDFSTILQEYPQSK